MRTLVVHDCIIIGVLSSWTRGFKKTLFSSLLFFSFLRFLVTFLGFFITTIYLQIFQMAVVEKYTINLPPMYQSIDDESPVRRDVSVSLPPKVLELPTLAEANQPHNFPEGGLKACLTVLGAFMVLACTFGQMSAFGTYQSWYASHQLQHLPASTISWIGSLQFWVFFFSVRFIFKFLSPLRKSFDPTPFLIIRVLPSDACSMHMDQLS